MQIGKYMKNDGPLLPLMKKGPLGKMTYSGRSMHPNLNTSSQMQKKSPQEELFMIGDGFSLSHHHDYAIFRDTLHEDFGLHASLLHERPCLPYVHVAGTETVHIARASRPL